MARKLHFGPARVPSRESPEDAIAALLEGGNERRHLPYGEGTLRAEPLRDALAQFSRPATVISESPDEASTEMIRAILEGV
jgi:endonuclease IV